MIYILLLLLIVVHFSSLVLIDKLDFTDEQRSQYSPIKPHQKLDHSKVVVTSISEDLFVESKVDSPVKKIKRSISKDKMVGDDAPEDKAAVTSKRTRRK